jgi:hypothetical protein
MECWVHDDLFPLRRLVIGLLSTQLMVALGPARLKAVKFHTQNHYC